MTKAIHLTEEQLETALRMAHAGKSLQQIHVELGVSAQYFWEFRQQNTQYAEKFANARDEGYDVLADSLVGITDRVPDVQKARLESENMRWLLARRKSRVYGDKLDLNVQHTVDIGAAIDEGRRRALGARPVAELPAPQRGGTAGELQRIATGAEPVAALPAAPERRAGRAYAVTEPTPTPRQTAPNGPITHRDVAAATTATPTPTQCIAGPYSAPNAVLSTPGALTADDPIDIFS